MRFKVAVVSTQRKGKTVTILCKMCYQMSSVISRRGVFKDLSRSVLLYYPMLLGVRLRVNTYLIL